MVTKYKRFMSEKSNRVEECTIISLHYVACLCILRLGVQFLQSSESYLPKWQFHKDLVGAVVIRFFHGL